VIGYVVELGGQILTTWHDSLLVRPVYIELGDSTGLATADSTVFVASRARGLPELVVVPLGDGIIQREYRYPKKQKTRLFETVALYSLPAFLAVISLGKVLEILQKM
jgi:hypothetical protein